VHLAIHGNVELELHVLGLFQAEQLELSFKYGVLEWDQILDVAVAVMQVPIQVHIQK
jgi:hypothetical protein